MQGTTGVAGSQALPQPSEPPAKLSKSPLPSHALIAHVEAVEYIQKPLVFP